MSKEQIEEIMKDLCQNDFCSSECRGHCRFPVDHYCWDVEIVAEKLYNAGYRKQEWISVEERLPDGQGRFLIADEAGDMMVAFWTKQFGWLSSVRTNKVTHWMPLPMPPKGGE